MVATHIVDIFPLVVGEGLELAYQFFSLLILRDTVRSRHVSHINGKVPRKRGAALCPTRFGLSDGFDQTVAAMALVGANVSIPKRPDTQSLS
jgi:hypothetical protein